MRARLAGEELQRDGEPAHLEPQAFDLLVYLVEHRDRVVPKAELLDRVWGHGFLSESNLTTRVKEVRRAIGDDGTCQQAIRNVRGRGYRFVAPIELLDGPQRTSARRGRCSGGTPSWRRPSSCWSARRWSRSSARAGWASRPWRGAVAALSGDRQPRR